MTEEPQTWNGVNCWQCPVCGHLVICEDSNPDEDGNIECEGCRFLGGY